MHIPMPGNAHSLGTLLRERGLVLASGNPGKLAEFRRLLGALGVGVFSPQELGIQHDIEETAEDFAGNALIKARVFAAAAARPALADDSGLIVDALGGEPGVRSARYGGPDLDDVGRRRLVLQNMRAVPDEQRSARFVCVLALCTGTASAPGPQGTGPGPGEYIFEGVAEGRILREERGSNGFGYDPIFFDPVVNRGFAELTPTEKDARSHRGQAVRRLLAAL